jgi:hypothetical protein
MNSILAGQADTSPKVENSAQSPLDSSAPGANRRGLRSPLLDSDGQSEAEDVPQSAFPHRQIESPSEAPSDQKPVRPNKFLRSPLLSGGYEDEEEEEIPPRNQPLKPKDSAALERPQRLHSPVLDGLAGGGDQFEPDDYFEVEEINDPNILRSPLLAARLPLQEKPPTAKAAPPPEETRLKASGQELADKTAGPAGTFNSLATPASGVTKSPEPSNDPTPVAQQSEFLSIPPPSPGNFAMPTLETPKVEPPRVEPPKFEAPKIDLPKVEPGKVEAPKVEPPRVEPPRVEAPRVEPPKSLGGFQSSNLSGFESPPAAQMLRGQAPGSNYLNKPKAPQPTAEPEASEWQGGDSSNRSNRGLNSSRSPLLNRSLEEMESAQSGRVRRLSTPTVGILFAILVLTKAYYLFSLGPSALSPQYFPFLVDQVAQLVVIICLIISA